MIVLGIETSTSQTTVALGIETGTLGSVQLSGPTSHGEVLTPAIAQLLTWTEIPLRRIGGVAVGLGPGLFTGLRVGVATGKALAQVLGTPIVALSSLDVLAFAVRTTRRPIAAVVDGRRGEVFYALYRPVPGGVARETEYAVGTPAHLLAELQALAEEVLCVGNGAILYRKELESLGGQVEFASPMHAHPHASALVELAIPRMMREESDRLYDVVPIYLRKSDAEIAWDQRARGA